MTLVDDLSVLCCVVLLQFDDDVEGTGMGEGEGKKDVTDQIEDEEQLLGLKGDKEEKEQAEQGKELGDDQDKGMEMENDFDGEMFDVPKGEEKEDGSDEEKEELDREMGDLGDDADIDVVDEKLWDQEDDEDGDDEGRDDRREEKFEEGWVPFSVVRVPFSVIYLLKSDFTE